MCGFAGFIGQSSYPSESRRGLLIRMGKQLARRGPDDEQIYDDGRLAFVFRRLSIIDVDGGRQPIWNEDETVFVAVNGEIYNHHNLRRDLERRHQFRTRSDSEVVLHLYEELGSKCLAALNGIFAIILWDSVRGRLFLARDRLGVKPLYYSNTESGLIFGSELKALLVHPECPIQPSWRDAVEIRAESTFVRHVWSLPGGWSLARSPDGIVEKSEYWSIQNHFPVPGRPVNRTCEELIEEYADLVEESVRRQLMSDVPVGIFLSGGLDSGAIAAIAASERRDIHCFTIDERMMRDIGDVDAARFLAETLKLPFHPVDMNLDVFLEQIRFSLSRLEYFVWMMDSPRFDLEQLMKHELHRYVRTLIPGLKVILLGQGADEFAGGYTGSGDWQSTVDALASTKVIKLDPASGSGAPMAPYHQYMMRATVALQRHNLWHEDRTAASQGIEARVPFLDHRLVEFLAGIPGGLHEELFREKAILRKAARRWLPVDFTRRPKSFRSFADALSIERIGYLLRGMLEATLPEFREKYLSSGALLPISENRFQLLIDRTQQGDVTASNGLLAAMSSTIFDRLCSSLRNSPTINALDPPSPLRETGYTRKN
jgi:asparagine synthase (glutamine-hydrolysing)